MSFYEKYLKYKKKYLELKKEIYGGAPLIIGNCYYMQHPFGGSWSSLGDVPNGYRNDYIGAYYGQNGAGQHQFTYGTIGGNEYNIINNAEQVQCSNNHAPVPPLP